MDHHPVEAVAQEVVATMAWDTSEEFQVVSVDVGDCDGLRGNGGCAALLCWTFLLLMER